MSSLQKRLGFPHEGLQDFALATKCSDLLKPRKSENDGVGRETNVGEVGREVVGGSVGERKTHKNKKHCDVAQELGLESEGCRSFPRGLT